jgi:tryptophan synthase alpha chain
MITRYTTMFAEKAARNEGAFVPFVVLGDPNLATSFAILTALVRAGADALELGIAFSDPQADGPVIQRADERALAAGANTQTALSLIKRLRAASNEIPQADQIPIGLLVYASLVETPKRANFYARAAQAGVDSVLIADVPTLEAAPFAQAAMAAGIAPVLIATPGCSSEDLRTIAALSPAYTYVVTRAGVTGIDEEANTDQSSLLQQLTAVHAAPSLLGFGISQPRHVRNALDHGAAGVICGSAIVKIIEKHAEDPELLLSELTTFVREMKQATVLASPR